MSSTDSPQPARATLPLTRHRRVQYRGDQEENEEHGRKSGIENPRGRSAANYHGAFRGTGLLVPGKELGRRNMMGNHVGRIVERELVLQAPREYTKSQSDERECAHTTKWPFCVPTVHCHRSVFQDESRSLPQQIVVLRNHALRTLIAQPARRLSRQSFSLIIKDRKSSKTNPWT